MARRRGRGEGSVTQLPSKRWRAVIVLRTVGNKKDRLGGTFGTKVEALAWLRERQNEHASGRLSASKLTVGTYLDEWFRRRTPTVQAATAAFYAGQVKRLKGSAIAGTLLRKLTRQAVEHAVPSWGTIDQRCKALATLRIVLNEAVRDGIIPGNVARTARKPKADAKQVVYWTAEEVRWILTAAAGSHLEALFYLGFDSAMRPGEMLGLAWDSVDLAAGTVRVVQSLEDIGGRLKIKEPKSRKGRRTIRIGKATCAALEAHRARMLAKGQDVTAGPVFVGQRTGRWIAHSVFYQKYYRPVLEASGAPLHKPYGMRHSAATLLLAAGVNLKILSERMGHEDITTTLRHYAHTLPDADQAAAVAADTYLLGAIASPGTHAEPVQTDTSAEVIVA